MFYIVGLSLRFWMDAWRITIKR